MNELVSIIVPVFNVEMYLPECIESIINQTYKNIEIILVDDGSRDKSGEICDLYSKEDTRIKVIHKKNTGVADSRNVGLKCAEGEYLFFVDSDDMLRSHTIELMLKILYEYNADMVCAEWTYLNGNNASYDDVISDVLVMNTQQAMRYYAQKEWHPWNKLIKKQIHENIEFPNYKIHEDEAIRFKILSKCNKIVKLDAKTYCYRKREGSITASSSENVDRMDMFYSRMDSLQWLERNYHDIAVLFLNKVCEDALYNLGLLVKVKRNPQITNKINEIIAFANKYYLKIMFNRYCKVSYKLRFTLVKLSNWKKTDCLYVRFYRLIGR